MVYWQAFILAFLAFVTTVLLFKTCWRGRSIQKQLNDRHLHDLRDGEDITDEVVVTHLENVNKTIYSVIGITLFMDILVWVFS